MADFLFRGSLADLDPALYELTELEAERQARKLILIPSESIAPLAVRESLASPFQNIYAEGYPDEETRRMSESQILDYNARIPFYRRYSDPRYYKGTEYVDAVEALARRRCAELFSTTAVTPDQIYVNVQPLSGAPANNAVYNALIDPGDTILGMNLLHGGHLSHGSSVNRSGKLYHVAHYNVNPETEQIDYESVKALAKENNPKIIIAGYSSYPWAPDWEKFRAIADSVGAILMADISHIAGMVAAGLLPSPVGYADVITFTTHKTLCGPRGACIITTDALLSRKIDRGVFPGEQGGPHVHVFAAMSTAFKLAKTDQFRQLQQQILLNCQALTRHLKERGIRIPYGGTNTHLANLDCKTIVGPDGTSLSGDLAARIMDAVGIVLNRNTIPGDKTANKSSGLRFGTPWMTQRGLREPEMIQVADIMADVLQATTPYSIETNQGKSVQAKIDFNVFEDAKIRTRNLAEKAGADIKTTRHSYPHYFYLDDEPATKGDWAVFDLQGDLARYFVNFAFTSKTEALTGGQSQKSRLITQNGVIDCFIGCVDSCHYRLCVLSDQSVLAATWLRDLSDSYITFDTDITRRIPGLVAVISSNAEPFTSADEDAVDINKPYFIGIKAAKGEPLPAFNWVEQGSHELRRTPLNELHHKLGAKMAPFAGWDMPVWYTSISEEHLATRQAAGLFDISHMGVWQVEGSDAGLFLDSVCGNDILALKVGESCYTHFLDPDAKVIDDIMVFRRTPQKYMLVVNASNDDKDWAWLNAVRSGKVRIDNERPWVQVFGRGAHLCNLRSPDAGADMRVDIALQGPRSLEILLGLGCDAATVTRISTLKRAELCEAVVGGFDLIVSRTGYTGEKIAFEFFVHPNKAVDLWNALLQAGLPIGLKPCGLGARDSLRIEAGLPFYGMEMRDDNGLGVAEAGFGSYIKVYKPWFIGRNAFIAGEKTRKGIVVRFRFSEKGARMAHHGDAVLDQKGRIIGVVTSCSIGSEGFLIGQAFVEFKSSQEGTPILIYPGAPKNIDRAPVDLSTGDRFTLPVLAVILSRFPKFTQP